MMVLSCKISFEIQFLCCW